MNNSWLDSSGLSLYLSDGLTIYHESNKGAKTPNDLSTFLASYFKSVSEKNHILLRSMAFCYLNDYNARSFIIQLESLFTTLLDLQGNSPTLNDILSSIRLICPDFPPSIVQDSFILLGSTYIQPSVNPSTGTKTIKILSPPPFHLVLSLLKAQFRWPTFTQQAYRLFVSLRHHDSSSKDKDKDKDKDLLPPKKSTSTHVKARILFMGLNQLVANSDHSTTTCFSSPPSPTPSPFTLAQTEAQLKETTISFPQLCTLLIANDIIMNE